MKSVCIIACLATNGMAAEPMRKFKEATHTKSLHIDINTKGEILAHEPDENEDENEKQVVALEGLAQGAAEKWMASINRYVGFDISRLASQAGNVTAEEQMRRAMTQLMDTSNKSNPWSLPRPAAVVKLQMKSRRPSANAATTSGTMVTIAGASSQLKIGGLDTIVGGAASGWFGTASGTCATCSGTSPAFQKPFQPGCTLRMINAVRPCLSTRQSLFTCPQSVQKSLFISRSNPV